MPKLRWSRSLAVAAALVAATFVLATLVLVALWFASAPHPAVAADDPYFREKGDVGRGKLVFTAAGCASCHGGKSESDLDDRRLSGGLALKTPFGIFYAPNISSDKNDGIGAWSDAEVANAFLSGVGRDGEHLYPVLPYTSYARMTRSDARDLVAYLRTLPAVAGAPPQNDVQFPFSIRRAVGLWKALFFHPRQLTRDPNHDATWNRGRYLTLALTHCAECHSPRNPLGGIVRSEEFAGGPDPSGEGWMPNITPGPDGIGDWSQQDIAEVLTDGLTPDDDKVNAPMSDVVHNIAQLPKTDAEAIADYIKSLPPRAGPTQPKTKN